MKKFLILTNDKKKEEKRRSSVLDNKDMLKLKLLNMVQQQKELNQSKVEKEQEHYFSDLYTTI